MKNEDLIELLVNFLNDSGGYTSFISWLEERGESVEEIENMMDK